MALDLNDKPPEYRDFHTDKTPRYIEQMPLLVSGQNLEGKEVDVQRIPVGVDDVFERKVNSSKPDWMDGWIYTGDGVAVPAKGAYSGRRFKVRRNSDSLRSVNPGMVDKLVNGKFPHYSYEAVPGVEFTSGGDVIVGRPQKKEEAKNNPVVLGLLGGDVSFRDEVVDRIFFEGKRRFDYNEMMDIYLPSESSQASEGAFCVYRLEYRSRLLGRNLLNYFARLVGKAPEVPNALDKSAQARAGK